MKIVAIALLSVVLVAVFRVTPLGNNAIAATPATRESLPKEAAFVHSIRLKVLSVTEVERTDKVRLLKLQVKRWYGKIETKSLERNQMHETQVLTILFPASPEAILKVGDTIDYRLSHYSSMSAN